MGVVLLPRQVQFLWWHKPSARVQCPTTTSKIRFDKALRRSVAFVWFGLLVGTSCPLGRTSIRDILDHPRTYHGKKVTIAGEVTQGVNLLVVRYFIVRDATGEIPVVTQGAVPRVGERVRVTGIVNQAFALGDQSLVVLIETDE